MPIASKDYSLELLLRECVESNRLDNGGKNVACPFIDWLRANQDASLDEYEAMLQANLEWGPEVCADIVRTSHRHNEPGAAAKIQALYVGFLLGYPFKRTRSLIERLLWTPPPGGWDRDALGALVAHLAKHHRNPRRFLSQAGVARHLPPGTDLSWMVDQDFDAPGYVAA